MTSWNFPAAYCKPANEKLGVLLLGSILTSTAADGEKQDLVVHLNAKYSEEIISLDLGQFYHGLFICSARCPIGEQR